MKTLHISKPTDDYLKVVKACFPDYRGRKFKLSTMIPFRLDSYWDEGSRTFFSFYQLSTGKTYDVQSNHPFFEKSAPRELPTLPPGIVICARSYFCGKDMGITIYANRGDLTKMLPTSPTKPLDENQKTVLRFTSAYRNSYAGESNIRFRVANCSTGITAEEWKIAQDSLVDLKLLRKNGSITPDGRNALEQGE